MSEQYENIIDNRVEDLLGHVPKKPINVLFVTIFLSVFIIIAACAYKRSYNIKIDGNYYIKDNISAFIPKTSININQKMVKNILINNDTIISFRFSKDKIELKNISSKINKSGRDASIIIKTKEISYLQLIYTGL